MLIPPELQSRLRDLRFTAHTSRGSPIGLHQGRSLGAGVEFAQYRPYEPGDELRRIDWRLYGRADRFFVREAQRDHSTTVWTLIDASASMAQADAERPAYGKLAAAKILAACIAEIACRQSDAFALAALSAQNFAWLAPATGVRHRDRFESLLNRVEPRGTWPAEASLRPLCQRIGRDCWIFLISDGFDPGLGELAQRLAAAGRHVASIGLLSCEERDFSFAGGRVFRDPETGAECRVDAPAERANFRARLADARAELARRLAADGVRHVDHVLDQPLDVPLRRLLREC